MEHLILITAIGILAYKLEQYQHQQTRTKKNNSNK